MIRALNESATDKIMKHKMTQCDPLKNEGMKNYFYLISLLSKLSLFYYAQKQHL